MERVHGRTSRRDVASGSRWHDTTEVTIPAGGERLLACITTSARARRVVIAANPCGYNRWCRRSAYLAKLLARAETAALLLDVMTLDEQAELEAGDADVATSAQRLVRATDWILRQPGFSGLPVGYLGLMATVGAVIAAADARPQVVRAVATEGVAVAEVSRALQLLEAPALVIVDHLDREPEPWRGSVAHQHGSRTVAVIPGAGRPLQHPRALERVGALIAEWFSAQLGPKRHRAA